VPSEDEIVSIESRKSLLSIR